MLSKLTAVLALCLVTMAARAAEPRSYAILSLVGDGITVTSRVPGARIVENSGDRFAVNDPMFDDTAIRAASASAKKAEPNARTFLMLSRDTELYRAQNAMFSDPAANQANRDYLKSLWQAMAPTHAILITTHRSDIVLRYAGQTDGSGKVEGLGFYMDNQVEVTNLDTLNNSSGVLVPFAHIKLRLVNATTLAVEREVTIAKTTIVTYAAGADRAVRTWQALTAKGKMDYMNAITSVAVSEGVSKLLAETASQ